MFIQKSLLLATVYLLNTQAFAMSGVQAEENLNFAFADCHDYESGSEPEGSPRLYEIIKDGKGNAKLKAASDGLIDGEFVFEMVNEDARFTTYKCWDSKKQISGFDPQLIAEILKDTKYTYINFNPIKWENIVVNGEEQLSFFASLNNGVGDAAMAGMSITDQRLEWGDMVGPIYKAGKRLMARKDNPNIDFKKLMTVPEQGYEPLRGLSVLVQGTSIRGDFFKKMNESYPDLIEYTTHQDLIDNYWKMNPDKFTVVEVEDFDLINKFIDSRMVGNIDLVMVDTGSTLSLTAEGKLGVETQLVTGNLSADPELGVVFGTGDGIAIKKGNSTVRNVVETELKKRINDGTVDALVERWFADDNAADHSWAKKN